jgi:hypothetical protein
MNAHVIVSRLCKCGCGRTFEPSHRRPGQEYFYGHKPQSQRQSPKGLKLVPPKPDAERRILDYRLALASAQREQAEVAARIDALDEQMEMCRQAIAGLQAEKDAADERHRIVTETIAALSAAI